MGRERDETKDEWSAEKCARINKVRGRGETSSFEFVRAEEIIRLLGRLVHHNLQALMAERCRSRTQFGSESNESFYSFPASSFDPLHTDSTIEPLHLISSKLKTIWLGRRIQPCHFAPIQSRHMEKKLHYWLLIVKIDKCMLWTASQTRQKLELPFDPEQSHGFPRLQGCWFVTPAIPGLKPEKSVLFETISRSRPGGGHDRCSAQHEWCGAVCYSRARCSCATSCPPHQTWSDTWIFEWHLHVPKTAFRNRQMLSHIRAIGQIKDVKSESDGFEPGNTPYACGQLHARFESALRCSSSSRCLQNSVWVCTEEA